MAAPRDEVVLPFPVPKHLVPHVTRVRSGLLCSSIVGLRNRGHFGRYYEVLPPEHRAHILGLTAGEWIDPELAFVHYDACEALGLPVEEQTRNGMHVAQHLQKGFVSVILRGAVESGVTPWSVLTRYQRLWARYFQGSAIEVRKRGPKEARAELVGFPLARIPYIRNGIGGVVRGVTELVARRVYVNILAPECTPTSLAYTLSWV
jgi:hypothetical protein